MKSRNRRHWVLALGAGLYLSLVPACQISRLPKSPTLTQPTNPIVDVPPAPVPVPTLSSDVGPQLQASNDIVVIPAAAPKAADSNAAPLAKAPAIDIQPVNPEQLVPALRVEPDATTQSAQYEEQSHREALKLPEAPILTALRCYLDKRPVEALKALAGCDPTTQELLICVLPIVVQIAEGGGITEQQAGMMIDQINSMLVALQGRAPLTIEKMRLCRNIKTFGVYEVMPENHLYLPSERVCVYAELRNFTSERKETRSGHPVFLTRLSSAVEIKDEAHRTVWKQTLHRDGPDQSQTQRHDYFDKYVFSLPELQSGRYTLEIVVEDVSTRRKARSALDLNVGSAARGM